MISRKALISILLGIAGVLIMTWRIGMLPARVVIINQSGETVAHVAIAAEYGRIEVGSVNNGQTKRVAVNPTDTFRVSYDVTAGPHVWNAPKGLSAGQSLVLYITPGGKIDARDRIGSYAR